MKSSAVSLDVIERMIDSDRIKSSCGMDKSGETLIDVVRSVEYSVARTNLIIINNNKWSHT